jgi:hypothetical protein
MEQPMIRRVLAYSVICFLLVGCGRGSPPPHAFAKHALNEGRYFLDCEDTGGGSSLSFRSTTEGQVVKEELYDFAWGGTHQLRIEDGNLIVDGTERGTLQPGDRLTITAAGEVLVNGRKR